MAAVAAVLALVLPYLAPIPAPQARVGATGAGAVAVGGDNRAPIIVDVSGCPPATRAPAARPGVHAGGPGSVAINGHNRATVRTKTVK